MTGTEYQRLAMRTNDGESTYRLGKAVASADSVGEIDFGGVLMACLGLSGEVGEFNDLIKKVVFHESRFDEEHAKKELGDILWYCAMMCEAFGWNLSVIMELNIEKLRTRYPHGFSTYRANNRKDGDN